MAAVAAVSAIAAAAGFGAAGPPRLFMGGAGTYSDGTLFSTDWRATRNCSKQAARASWTSSSARIRPVSMTDRMCSSSLWNSFRLLRNRSGIPLLCNNASTPARAVLIAATAVYNVPRAKGNMFVSRMSGNERAVPSWA